VARLLVLVAAAAIAAFLWWNPAPRAVIAPADAGARAPLPDWVILPQGERTVVASGTYPPQPPYGAAAVVTYRIAQTADAFVAAYGAQLAAAGYAVRRVEPADLPFNAPDAQFEADERTASPLGGHVIYITLRHGGDQRFAQLTFWAPPAPRMP